MIRHLRAYLAKLLNAADCGFMQSGTRDVFSCSAINLCISSETDNVVTLGEYRRTVWVPRRWWRRRRRGRGRGGAHEGRALVGDGEVVPANLLRENGSRGGRGLIDCLRFVVVIRRLASSRVGVLGKGLGDGGKKRKNLVSGCIFVAFRFLIERLYEISTFLRRRISFQSDDPVNFGEGVKLEIRCIRGEYPRIRVPNSKRGCWRKDTGATGEIGKLLHKLDFYHYFTNEK